MSEVNINASLQYITYGLYIVTVADEDKKNGMILNTVFQVTADPAQVAISVNKQSLTHEILLRTNCFAAMPLDQTATLPFIGNFGFRTGRNYDKFAKAEYTVGETGCPLVTQHTLSYLEAQVLQTLDVGTHTLFVGKIKNAGVFASQAPAMTYEYYHQVIKGKVPAGATHHF
ncbi:MAG: flavin reductase family protein [Elusimicrobiaceae bacterium]|nr:flavin reductase family protein [Elusimicrobiaceae bacterium]